MSARAWRWLGGGLLAAGTALALVWSALLVWANGEAAYYGFPHVARQHLALHCPYFVAQDETTTISATITNTNPHPTTFGIQSWLSLPLGLDTLTEHRRLAPGEAWHWSREIGPENRDLRYFVFASVYVFGGYPIPQRQSTCGAFVVPVQGISGNTIWWGGTALALILAVIGFGFWWWGQRNVHIPTNTRLAAKFFFVLTPLSLAVAMWGPWMLGVAVLVVGSMAALIFISGWVAYGH
ncbi:MAG: hypothetical protein GXO56_00635 [Chloroflexi bacterium]|nr:hypothetical protein [Chloroflexota bacterium]